ncbi:GNAT family N-acetyltransferase [Pseudomonas sp. RIT-PI-o]|uniref:GNAT family N-acetyltransferase n=1 Tax=Pseudomonas sp. RIT-PI-o TaxID=1690246 RepID=UPI0007DAB58E|nr:GNAT family N-acetyltransferase [Pseudomonas sp. RIT-PI-o]
MSFITTDLTEGDIDQAIKLARANYVELINKFVKPHGPTSSLCIAQVEAEVREYLLDALTGCYGGFAEVVLARDQARGNLVGFLIVLRGNDPEDCGISYTVVCATHRRQGILREMLRRVQGQYSHIGLSCNVDKVPYYEALGFHITGSDCAQVAMCCGTDKPDAMMGALDFSLNSKIADAVASFQRVHGAKAKGILSRMGEIQERRFEYVEGYVNKRLSGLSHADAL